MPPVKIICESHSIVLDIELVDTRRRGYRTARGRLRPCFTFVFAPAASLALAFSLSADRLERQTIAALLYSDRLLANALFSWPGRPASTGKASRERHLQDHREHRDPVRRTVVLA
jgi:hypothetical protein